MEYCCGCFWNQGRRKKNQDSVAFWQMSNGKKTRILGVVCDGIGGLEEGETASGFLVRQLAAWFLGQGYLLEEERRLEASLHQMLYQCHEQLQAYSREKKLRLGTTLTLFLIRDSRVYWAHCGDSRLYFFHRRKSRLLTRDDVEATGALNRAMGLGEWKGVSAGRCRLREGDGLLLCTDGFYRGLKEEEMESLAPRNLQTDEQVTRLLEQLGKRRLYLGEKDNLSALYCVRCRKE